MSSPHSSRTLALLLSLAPGWGHVYLGRERAGMALFTMAALCLFALVNLLLVYFGELRLLYLRLAGGGALFFWLTSVADVWRRTSPRRLRRLEREKEDLLRRGMIAYLRGQPDLAQEAFRASLRLDGDDVEALVRMGVVAARSGAVSLARRALRRARRVDLAGKWTWEIGKELLLLREKPGALGEGRAIGLTRGGLASGGLARGDLTRRGLPEGDRAGDLAAPQPPSPTDAAVAVNQTVGEETAGSQQAGRQ